jgi:cytochrome oxidase Cu insertion factor (SCO1/SenC/PrrC family)
MPSRRTLALALSVLAVALLTGLAALYFSAPRGPVATGTALIGGPFSLVDHHGKRVREKDFAGKYTLIFFGYTFCPDICPSTLQVMSAALDKMGADAEPITPVFVTIDPERDTVQVMKDYVANFHPRMVGLTGTAEEIAAMAKEWRVYYAKPKREEGKSDYLMDHATFLYLMGPDGKFVKLFEYTTDAAALADRLRAATHGNN